MITNVLEYLEDSAEKYPDKAAFVDEWETYTYTDLKKYGQAIGTEIEKYNLFRKPVAVYLEKSVKAVASFLGVLYSGNFYCPIDVSMPLQRVKTILDILETPIIITDKEHAGIIEQEIEGKKLLFYDDIIQGETNLEQLKDIRRKSIDMDPMYVLFTSGSTGIPKGVVVSQQPVIEYTEWVTKTFHITSQDSFGNQAPFYFDNSILDIYCGLKNSATVYIIPKVCFVFPMQLLEYLNENRITTVFFVPSVLCTVAKLRALSKVSLRFLKNILFAGEVMSNKYLNIWRKHVPDALYANLYGPTEITDVCIYYILDREFSDDEQLPIGVACQNTDYIILDENNHAVSKGKIGELCIRGRSLSLGYYKNKEKSEEVFIQNPLNQEYRDLIYCTGDLVKVNEKNEILYLGRKDFQIKHMGHRIELGEIEASAGGFEGIETCACIYDDKKRKIVFFYKGPAYEDEELEELFSRKVPAYMIPNVFVKVNQFPYNANGKLDRKQLKEVYMSGKAGEL